MNTLLHFEWSVLMHEATPLMALIGLAFVVLAIELWAKRSSFIVAGLGIVAVLLLMPDRWFAAGGANSLALLLSDRVTWLSMGVILSLMLAVLTMSGPYLKARDLPRAEFVSLLLFSGVGLWVMIATDHVLLMFVGLETLSLAAYVLAAYHRQADYSVESGMKYFLLGAFASAFIVFGMAYLYGGTGSLDLTAIAGMTPAYGGASSHTYVLIGVACLLVGFGFKVSAVPFHFWTPDVYQGAPLPVTSFFATAVKLGAFVALWRIVNSVYHFDNVRLHDVLWCMAVATMLFGNLAALLQRNVKRMLAYSSVAHAGYALLALLVIPAISADAASSLLLYLISYGIMTMVAFTVLMVICGEQAEEITDIDAFAGLARQHPALAAVFAIALLSLAGIPPTVGFVGKYYLFSTALHAGEVSAVLFAVVSSVVSVAYYVRPIVAMYFKASSDATATVAVSRRGSIVLAIGCALILYLGLFPDCLIQFVRSAVEMY